MTIINQITSFKISGFTYTGTDTQLNYTSNVTAGAAQPSKALVLDTSSNIIGINSINSTNLTTTNLTVNGTLFSTNIINNLSTLDGVTAGTATANKALIVDASRNITNINSLTSTNLIGSIQTVSQPLITTIGTLTSLTSNGNVNIAQHNGTTTGLQLNGTLITSTATELNVLDGILATTAELNKLSGVTTTTNELNKLSGVTASTSEINKLTGLTATTNELNLIAGITPGTASASKVLIINGSRNISNLGDISSTGNINTSVGRVFIQNSSLGLSHKNTTGGTSEIITSTDGINNNFIGTSTLNDFSIATNNLNRLNIKSTGKLGINTTDPTRQLDINASDGNCLRLIFNDNDGSATTYCDQSISGTGNFSLTSAGSSPGFTLTGGSVLINNSIASTNTTTGALQILGGVGIGGSLNAGSHITSAGTIMINKTSSPNAVADFIGSNTYLDGSFNRVLRCSGAHATPVIFDIKVNQNTAATSTNSVILGTSTNNDLELMTNNSSKIKILANGLIGIGISNPIFTLDVNGSINSTGVIRTSVAGQGFMHTDNTITLISYVNNAIIPGKAFFGTSSNHTLSLQTFGTERLGISNTGNVNIVNHNETTTGLQLNGILVTASAAELNKLDGVTTTTSELNTLAGVTAGTASASKVLVLDSSRNITNINGITTTAQIRSVSNSICFRADLNNIDTDFFYGAQSTRTFRIQSTTSYGILLGNASADTLSIMTNNAPQMTILSGGNIGIGITTPSYKLDISGSLNCTSFNINSSAVSATAAQLNYVAGVTAGTASASKALVLDSSSNITGINNLTSNGITLGSTSNFRPLTILKSNLLNGENISFTLGRSSTSDQVSEITFTYSTTAGQSRLSLGHYGNPNMLNVLSNGNVGIGVTSPAQTLEINGNIKGSRLLLGTSSDSSSTRLISILDSTITTGSTLRNICLGKAATANNQVEIGFRWVADDSASNYMSLGLHSNSTIVNILGSGNVGIGTSSPSYKLDINGSLNCTSFNINSSAVTATAAQLNYLSGVTTGIAGASKALVLDSSSNITNINSLTTTSLSTTNLTLGGTVVSATAAQLNFLSGVTAGTASASKALVVDSNLDISTIRNISMTGNLTTSSYVYSTLSSSTNANFVGNWPTISYYGIGYDSTVTAGIKFEQCSGTGVFNGTLVNVRMGNLVATKMGIGTSTPIAPLEINGGNNVTLSYGWFNSSAQTGTASGTNSYSLYCSARVACTELNAYSDLRIKSEISDLNIDFCKEFILNMKPKKYKLADGIKYSYGYIAQDLLKNNYDDLVDVIGKEGMEELIDEDNFVSPKDGLFVLNYNNLVPILAKNIENIYNEKEDLENKVNILENENKLLKDQLKQILIRLEILEKNN
jgi:hypothetical protein